MTGQLDIFNDRGREPLEGGAATSSVTSAEEDAALRERHTEPTSRPETTDDGSLHWMLTGQPEPRKAA